MNWKGVSVATLLALSVSCAFAPGPPVPLGLGPGLDGIAPLLLIVGLALLAWKFWPSLNKRFKSTDIEKSNEETAHAIARQRYARGEITREEFMRISEDLNRPV